MTIPTVASLVPARPAPSSPATAAPSLARRRFVWIQGLRAAAAILVMMEHLKNEIGNNFLEVDPSSTPLAVFPYGSGVDIFFVISGFVIAHSSAALHGTAGAWKVFLFRRFARVVPLYWLLTLVFLALLVVSGNLANQGDNPGFILKSLLFIPVENARGLPLPLLPLGWTLNYEMLFYAVFALFVGLRQGLALAAVSLVMLALAAYNLIADPAGIVLRVWSDPMILEFVAGIVIYVLVSRGLRFSRPVRAGLVALALAVLALSVFPDIADRWYRWGGPAALLVLAAVTAREEDRRGGVRRGAEVLGDLSYAIYLSHLFVLLFLTLFFVELRLTSPLYTYAVFPLLAVVGTLIASAVLHFGFEKPVMRYLRRRFDRDIREGPGAVPGP